MIQANLLEPLAAAHPNARRWVLAYSGGIDSHVLLHLCVKWRADRIAIDTVPELIALHINHGVHGDAGRWAEHCRQVCDDLGVVCINRELAPGDATEPAVSEAALRDARYAVFNAFVRDDDLLLLAHQRDDQAETVLLRLLRGAGARGLSGMPRERPIGRSRLCRPLLGIDRTAIRDYAKRHDLRWIEDPGNAGDEYDRSFLRNRVMPLLEQRWPGAGRRIAQAADHLRETESVCAERAREDMQAAVAIDDFGQAYLDLAVWRGLSPPRAGNLLRRWLQQSCWAAPEAAHLATVAREIIGSRADARPGLRLGRAVVTRFRQRLYAVPRSLIESPPVENRTVVEGQEMDIPGYGRVIVDTRCGGGIRSGKHHEIRFRQLGESCSPPGRPRKPLKKWLQELDVPPWLRYRLPLVYVDDELAAVAHLFVCEEFVAAANEPSLCLRRVALPLN